MKHLIITLTLALASMTAGATVPVGYYSTINGKRGQDLKNAVHALLKKHTVVTYGSLWYYFQSTDCYPDNTGRVWDMYSNRLESRRRACDEINKMFGLAVSILSPRAGGVAHKWTLTPTLTISIPAMPMPTWLRITIH